jgi:hypothetical protein
MLLSRTGEEKRNTRRYGAAACKEDGLCGRNFTQERVRRRLRASTVVAGMLALAAAHCMAGFITYGVKDWSSVSVKLLQVGSLQLSTASPELVQEAVKQSWENEVEPSQRALEQQGEAILSEMRALKHVASQVVAVQVRPCTVEARDADKVAAPAPFRTAAHHSAAGVLLAVELVHALALAHLHPC